MLSRVYRFGQDDISAAIEALLNAANVAVNRPAVDAGLAILKAGGETFVSFDKKAVALITGQGRHARLLA